MNAVCDFFASLKLDSNFYAAILGAVVGAVVGGVISWLLQLSALRQARKDRGAETAERHRAIGAALIFKTMRMHSSLTWIHLYMERIFSRVTPALRPWQVYKPIINVPPAIHFTSEEMGLLLILKTPDALLNEMLVLDQKHNSITESMRFLNAERKALGEQFKVEVVNGDLVTGKVDIQLAPRMIDVDSMAESIRVDVARYVPESRKALEDLQTLLSEKLALKTKLKFIADTVEEKAA